MALCVHLRTSENQRTPNLAVESLGIYLLTTVRPLCSPRANLRSWGCTCRRYVPCMCGGYSYRLILLCEGCGDGMTPPCKAGVYSTAVCGMQYVVFAFFQRRRYAGFRNRGYCTTVAVLLLRNTLTRTFQGYEYEYRLRIARFVQTRNILGTYDI